MSWFKDNILANPFLNPIGAAIKMIRDKKTIKQQNANIALYNDTNDAINQQYAAELQKANDERDADAASDKQKNILFGVVMAVFLVIIVILLFKSK
jgi:hypothetical protein